MRFIIETARDQYRTKTEGDLRLRHEAMIQKMTDRGVRGVSVHEVSAPKTAEVNHGIWLINCECGSGVAVDPAFSAAYCFGCGAVHTHIDFPDEEDRLNIEHALLSRDHSKNRNWKAEETLADLLVEGVAHGARLRGAGRR